ncbi:MAG: hypothetical protein ABW104_12135 [Candidatus Thiodiazotropha sp. 6PLUC2]
MKWRIFVACAFLLLAIFGAGFYPEFMALDKCLDTGGSYDYENCRCDYKTTHEYKKEHSCKFKGESMEWLKIISVVGAFLIIGVGLYYVFERLKAKNQGFGPNSLRAIGIVIFVPVLLILAVVTEFKTETLAALLGAVAGYVLSNSKPNDE